jgi:hypothetical protein
VNAASDAQLSQYQQNAVTPGSFTLSTSAAGSSASTPAASGATTGGTGATTSRSASAAGSSTTTSRSAGFFNAQVGLGVVMMVLAGSFGALFV